jgi:hypothetical protein
MEDEEEVTNNNIDDSDARFTPGNAANGFDQIQVKS